MNGLRINQGINQKVSGNKWKWKWNNPNLWETAGSPEREVHSNIGLPKKDRNISNKQPNPISTRTGGTTNKTQSE